MKHEQAAQMPRYVLCRFEAVTAVREDGCTASFTLD